MNCDIFRCARCPDQPLSALYHTRSQSSNAQQPAQKLPAEKLAARCPAPARYHADCWRQNYPITNKCDQNHPIDGLPTFDFHFHPPNSHIKAMYVPECLCVPVPRKRWPLGAPTRQFLSTPPFSSGEIQSKRLRWRWSAALGACQSGTPCTTPVQRQHWGVGHMHCKGLGPPDSVCFLIVANLGGKMAGFSVHVSARGGPGSDGAPIARDVLYDAVGGCWWRFQVHCSFVASVAGRQSWPLISVF